ncbi:unnamed protein product [Schistocephalus solidus]|uniref:Uncharacterized protein n=1 Tax=Schistocephalus solidus TaxID=70667 RepID=A0A183TPE3_SCHSO|nr:unnamed protein product [Schistocephalus solidus]
MSRRPQPLQLSSMLSARSLEISNTLGSCNRTFNVVSNSRGVIQRLPAGPSIPVFESFPRYERNCPEHTGAGAVLRWSPRLPNPQGFLRDRPSALDNALTLAREEIVLQIACEQLPQLLFGFTAV